MQVFKTRVFTPDEFVARVLRHAPKSNVHVINHQSHFPQMVDPLWRNDVLDILARNHTNKFSKVYFTGPDELDDEWLFVATKTPEAWLDHALKEFVEVPPQDPGIRPWSQRHGMLFTLAIVALVLSTCVLFYMMLYISLGGSQ